MNEIDILDIREILLLGITPEWKAKKTYQDSFFEMIKSVRQAMKFTYFHINIDVDF